MSHLREEHWDLPADPEAVSEGREMVKKTLASWGVLNVELVDDTMVIVSELYTNALQYGAKPITMTLRCHGRCLGGEVVDQGDPFIPPPRASDDDIHGRGLHIVDALVDQWGVDPVQNGSGKVVWFKRCW